MNTNLAMEKYYDKDEYMPVTLLVPKAFNYLHVIQFVFQQQQLRCVRDNV